MCPYCLGARKAEVNEEGGGGGREKTGEGELLRGRAHSVC